MASGSGIDEDRSGDVLAVCISVIVLNIIAVALRVTSRLRTKEAIRWDDWTAIMALPISIAQAAVVIWWVSVGFGKHQATVTHPVYLGFLATFIYQVVYIYALFLVKISALLFYIRVFGVVRWFRYLCWATMAMVVAWDLGVTFQSIFACVPPEKFWRPEIPGTCVKVYSEYLGNGIPNAFTDLAIVLLPMPMVWRLQTDLKHKLALTFVFACSYALVGISIARAAIIAIDGVLYPLDYTWYPVRMWILAVLEPGLGLVLICLPAMIKLFEVWTNDVRAWWSSRHSQSTDAPGFVGLSGGSGGKEMKHTHRERHEADSAATAFV